MQSRKPPTIEPGLLQLFKLFTMWQWLLLLLGFCNISNADSGTAVMVTLMLLHTTILLLYLRIERFQHWFGRLYLPLALIGASFVPIVLRALAVVVRLDEGMTGLAAAGELGTLVLWLFAPLVAVAAQYGFVMVILFNILTTTLELTFALALADAGSVPVSLTGEQAFIRVLVFLAVGFIISRLISEQRRQRESLRDANERLSQMAITREQLAISRERNRLARDLHDTLAHTLSAVSIQLEAVTTIWDKSPTTARQRIETIQHITREGLTETRRALRALRTSPLDDLGLPMALQHLAEKSAERGGFTLQTHIAHNVPDLPAETEINLYRIAEEALNNVVNHAEAREVWVSLSHEADAIELRIRDNGVGFDSDNPQPQGHYGIIGMCERATLTQGTLIIESAPALGTDVIFRI